MHALTGMYGNITFNGLHAQRASVKRARLLKRLWLMVKGDLPIAL